MRRVVWCQNAINFKLIAKKKYRNKNADKKNAEFLRDKPDFFSCCFHFGYFLWFFQWNCQCVMTISVDFVCSFLCDGMWEADSSQFACFCLPRNRKFMFFFCNEIAHKSIWNVTISSIDCVSAKKKKKKNRK